MRMRVIVWICLWGIVSACGCYKKRIMNWSDYDVGKVEFRNLSPIRKELNYMPGSCLTRNYLYRNVPGRC